MAEENRVLEDSQRRRSDLAELLENRIKNDGDEYSEDTVKTMMKLLNDLDNQEFKKMSVAIEEKQTGTTNISVFLSEIANEGVSVKMHERSNRGGSNSNSNPDTSRLPDVTVDEKLSKIGIEEIDTEKFMDNYEKNNPKD